MEGLFFFLMVAPLVVLLWALTGLAVYVLYTMAFPGKDEH